MEKIDIRYYFGFEYYYAGEDEAKDIEISEELYNYLHDVYNDSGTAELVSIFEDMEQSNEKYDELAQLIERLREKLIEKQEANGGNIDSETGEVYDFSGLNIEMEIVVPEKWDI